MRPPRGVTRRGARAGTSLVAREARRARSWASLVALTALVALAWLVAWPARAWAQDFELRASVDANEIELGDSVTYTLEATSTTSDPPSDPRLPAPQGFTVVDRGTAPTHMVSIINGRRSDKHGLTASWTLRADRLGIYTIGPATIALGGGRRSASAQRVTVVAPGVGRARPRRPGRPPFDPFAGTPFDPFKGLFGGLTDDDLGPPDPFGGLSADPKFSLDSPRAPAAFLHATLDKTRAVVGEQVTLTVYLYEDLRSRQGRISDVHEATATDFVKRSLLEDETRAVQVGHAMVGGQPWSVKLVRKNALFPIKAGRLSISPMSLTLPQMRGGLRESEALFVDVTEPPIAGRPVGYQIGDTGDFSLSATVSPREVEQHGAIGVTVELRGTGNMPGALPLPEVAGVEWLEPQTTDKLGAVSSEQYGGSRTFSYVVRVHKDGAIDLGEVRLPFFDPRTRRYSVARAGLGIVQVSRAAGRDATPEVAAPIFGDLPKARAALEGKEEKSYLTERPGYWGAVVGSPLACVAAIALAGAARRARERRANAAPSPERVARDRSAEAEAAMKGSDGKAATSAVARAVEAEVLASTGVNLRGTSGDAALRELTDAGVADAAARLVLETLSECERARFSPGGAPIDEARALWKRAREAIAAVRDTARSSSPPPSRGSR